ncbi:MAG TPA: hypothetical protein VH985_08680 [Candidatus Binatia bacterium]|jgi:hypothetical protein
MSHAKSLRVIGQSLEAARIATFELEKHDEHYLVWIVSLAKADELILRDPLSRKDVVPQSNRKTTANPLFCFSRAEISRLDAQAQKRRRNQSSSATRLSKMLSHQLRTLGDHLDRIEVSAFQIVWTPGSVLLDYQPIDGRRNCRIFTAEELRQLCLHGKWLRSSDHLFLRQDI